MLFRKYKDQYIQLLRLAAPVVFSQVGIASVQLFDNAMVGKLGELPLAAASFAGTVFFMIFIFVTGLSMALTPLVGEQYIQGKFRSVAAYFQNSIVFYTLIGVVTFAIQYSLIPLMYYMKQPVEVVNMAIPYYKMLAWSIIPHMIFASFKQFLEGIGNTTANMVIIISANLINVLFNWLLIYGNWGFPRLEALGAGVATLISRCCMPVFAILYFVCKERIRRYFRYFKRSNFSWTYIKSLASVGFPISLQMLMEGAAFALTSIMMGWIGTTAIAANQIALTVSNFAFMVVVGISAATTIRISHEYGRKNLKQLKRAANASYRLTLMWNAFTALMFILFRTQIASIFNSNPAVIEQAAYLMLFVAAFQFSDGLQSISVGILRGIQDVKRVMVIAFFSYLVINLPVGYLFAFILGWGPGGLWVGFIFGLSIAAILLITRFRYQYKLLWQKL